MAVSTAIHGKAGTASFSGLTFDMLSWSIDSNVDMAEVTVMGDTWKTFLAGFTDWTATAECVLPKAGAGIDALGTSALLTFVPSSGVFKDFVGTNGLCTGFSPTTDKDGIATITLTFQGNGPLVEAAVV